MDPTGFFRSSPDLTTVVTTPRLRLGTCFDRAARGPMIREGESHPKETVTGPFF